MAIRGVKPKSAAQKKLAGNPGQRRPRPEPKVDGKTPICPSHLDAEAKTAWRFLVRVLRGMGILASSDVAVMCLYCETWSQYVECRRQSKKFAAKSDGLGQFVMVGDKGNPYINPLLSAESMLKKQLLQYLGELGLSPVSRARVHTEGSEPVDDPLVMLMRRRAERFGEN